MLDLKQEYFAFEAVSKFSSQESAITHVLATIFPVAKKDNWIKEKSCHFCYDKKGVRTSVMQKCAIQLVLF